MSITKHSIWSWIQTEIWKFWFSVILLTFTLSELNKNCGRDNRCFKIFISLSKMTSIVAHWLSNHIGCAADGSGIATGPPKKNFKAHILIFVLSWTLSPLPLPWVTGRHPGAPLQFLKVRRTKFKREMFGRGSRHRFSCVVISHRIMMDQWGLGE